MIRTAKTLGANTVLTGDVEVKSNIVASDDRLTDDTSKSVPTQQRKTGVKSLQLGEGGVLVSEESVESARKSLLTKDDYTIPSSGGGSSGIASKNSTKSSKLSGDSNESTTQTRLKSTKKLEPFEQLTGLSQERPEILAISDFLPVYKDEVTIASKTNETSNDELSPAGKFIDFSFNMQNMQMEITKKMTSNVQKRYSTARRQFDHRKSEFKQNLEAIKDASDFLVSFSRSVRLLKNAFDLRDEVHKVDTIESMKNHKASSLRINSDNATQEDDVKKHLPETFTPSTALQFLGYVPKTVESTYASTKLWMQLLIELKTVLRYHSLPLLDMDRSAYKNDSSESVLIKHKNKFFAPKNGSIPFVGNGIPAEPTDMPATLEQLGRFWEMLYPNIDFKTQENKIAAIANFLSKEFRYSYALASPDVQSFIREKYGYNVSNGNNGDLFDAIVGIPAMNAFDTLVTQTNSLTSISQRVVNNTLKVLTFESHYIDTSSGVLTPGSAYYLDQTLTLTPDRKFTTSHLSELAQRFLTLNSSFDQVASSLNFYGFKLEDEFESSDPDYAYADSLYNPHLIVKRLLSSVVNRDTGATAPSVQNDIMTSVYSFAATNKKFKVALFMLMLVRMLREEQGALSYFSTDINSYDHPLVVEGLVNICVETLISALNESSITSNTNTATNTESFTGSLLRVLLVDKSPLVSFMLSAMSRMFASFVISGSIVSGYTKFSGHNDMLICMLTFDMLISMIAKFGNQTVTSVTYTGDEPTFVITKTFMNHKVARGELIHKLEKESAYSQMLCYTVNNTLSTLATMMKEHVDYLESSDTINRLRYLMGIVEDEQISKLMINEQQSILLCSAISDLYGRATVENADTNGNERFDSEEQIKFLDDSIITPKLRNVIFASFKDKGFLSKEGNNKKILTVGLPLGSVSTLKTKVSLDALKGTGYLRKQNDLIKLNVYKIDAQIPDIIYKPVSFLFELSRFPVRNDAHILSIPSNGTLKDVLNAYPTRNYDTYVTANDHVEYWNTAVLPTTKKRAFSDQSYDFLSDDEKEELIRNHTLSHVAELYMKLLSGLNISEYKLLLKKAPRFLDTKMTQVTMDHQLDFVANSTAKMSSTSANSGGRMFSRNAKYSKNSTQAKLSQQYGQASATEKALQNITEDGSINIDKTSYANTQDKAEKSMQSIKNMSTFANSLTEASDPVAVAKHLLTPKMFDRVFNVFIDPDEFEIDYAETVKSESGKAALEQLILSGDVIPVDDLKSNSTKRFRVDGKLTKSMNMNVSQNRIAKPVQSYRYRDRDKTTGDLTFDKYFVTIQTYSDEVV